MSATRRPLEAAGKLHTRVVELTALCAELERARQSAEAALLAKSAEYDALVARVGEVIANLNNATAIMRDKNTNVGPDRAWLTEQVNLLRLRLLVSDDRPSHTAGEK